MAVSRAALAMAALLAPAAAATRGSMSMWADTPDTLVAYKSEGSACKYADKAMGGTRAATAQTPYIQARKYCAVNRGMFGGGEICGACYRLTYHGDHEQAGGLGRPGSEIVQVVDSGSWATFDCHMNAFKKITGYNTAIFPITYERVPCDLSAGGPVAGVLAADYYFTKVVFNNLHYPVKSASVDVGDKSYTMKLIGGWWYVWTGDVKGPVTFQITEDSCEQAQIQGCFGGWELRKTGMGCTEGRHTMLELASADAPGLASVGNSAALAADGNASKAAGNLRGAARTTNTTGSVVQAGNNESADAAVAALVYP